MGILAIGEYIKHWKRNVFVVIQISVLLLVLCVSVTMLATIFRAYKPVQHMADKKRNLCNIFWLSWSKCKGYSKRHEKG